jgi:hypothetical protein
MNADSYRYKAQHYLTRARQMRSPDAKWSMIEVAAYWMRLAEQAEHQSDAQNQQHTEAHDERHAAE